MRDSIELALAGQDTAADAIDRILSRLADVPPHDDAPPTLAVLAADFRLIAISNSDDAFLGKTIASLGEVWDGFVTAEQAQAYKPNPELFRFARVRHGLEPSRHVHVAQGMFSDLAVCASLDIDAVWINRTGTTLQRGLTPRATLPDLSGLAATLSTIEEAQ